MEKAEMIKRLSKADLYSLEERDLSGYRAIDVSNVCFGELEFDPWDTLRALRAYFGKTRLELTLCGQCLAGRRHYSDEIVDSFMAAAVENGIDIIRIYDALNDPRNLETAINSAKKYGAYTEVAMIYTESPVYSASFFAGYAAQLASMGADSLCICGVTDADIARELVRSVKATLSVPLSVSASSAEICDAAAKAGAEYADIYNKEDLPSELCSEIELVRAESGYPPLAFPISEIITQQARLNLDSYERYAEISEDFRSLVLGKFGRTPAPIAQDFVSKICGSEPLALVRPADMIEPEYDLFREKVSPWFEQEEDILTYALLGDEAIRFFEHRKAKKYSLDMLHADPHKGIHTV